MWIVKSFKHKYKTLLRSAKDRGFPVDLNLKHFEELLDLGCQYCGTDLSLQNGYCLDRIDNSKGYTDNNVTPCCKECNLAKGTRTVSQFLDWIKKASSHQSKVLEQIRMMDDRNFRKSSNEYFNQARIKNSQQLRLSGDN
jgi:hypothetical protein